MVFEETDVSVDGQTLTVAVAETAAQKRQGLMQVEELPQGVDGMVFVYRTATSVTLHMRDTPMPLDAWWFDSNGVLLSLVKMEPCPEQPCASYRSPGPIGWVLETPAGVFDFRPGAMLSTIDNS